jgi:2-isopropylmalate synthase
LRKCLEEFPGIRDVKLIDYKVRVLDSKEGTAAKVRVLIEWSDGTNSWSTVGVSDDVIEASWAAMLDAVRLELMRVSETGETDSTAVLATNQHK